MSLQPRWSDDVVTVSNLVTSVIKSSVFKSIFAIVELEKKMISITDIKIEDVQDLFDSEIYARGEEYFEDGCVKALEPINHTTVTGIVQGNQNYNVSVSIGEQGDIVCECSCPCDFNCKHAVALLLKWLSVKGKYKKSKAEDGAGRETIDETLSKKSKEELIEITKKFLLRHPELKPLVKIEKGDIVQEIKSLFSHFWEWNETAELKSHLDAILEGIKKNKGSWNKELIGEIERATTIMLKNVGSVQDDGEYLWYFLEEWFAVYGEVFSKTNPSASEKKDFLRKIVGLIDKDDYGYDSSYEKALIGMCNSKEDILLIKEAMHSKKSEGWSYSNEELLLELYNKLGMDEEYIKTAKESGFFLEVIDKLTSLERFDDALKVCEEYAKTEFSEMIENKRAEILTKLGRENDAKEALFNLLKRRGDFSYFLKIKRECKKSEWKKTFDEIEDYAKSAGRFELLSRMYYNEGDFKSAYDYSESITDADYLELLAKKLGSGHPELAREIFKRLCFYWINRGSGWPYKKAGKMLEEIKKLDINRRFFIDTKEEIIEEHGKKHSLMKIIKAIR